MAFNTTQPRTLYRPRVLAILTLPKEVTDPSKQIKRLVPNDQVETIDIPIRVRSMHLTLNDHNHADSCILEAEYLDIGLDPRIITNAIVRVFIKEADEKIKKEDIKFVGIMNKISRSGSDEGLKMHMEFLDYTTLFIEHKHYNPKFDPTLSMTLGEAWATICSNIGSTSDAGVFSPSALKLKDRIAFFDDTSIGTGEQSESLKSVKIGAGAAERYRKFGKVPRKSPDMDAWAIWQTCCNMLG